MRSDGYFLMDGHVSFWRWRKTLCCTPHPTRLTPGHLPPRGKALVRGNLVGAEEKPTWSAGACRPCLSPWERWHGVSRDGEGFPSPPPYNEPGDIQWRGFIARGADSHCQRPPAALASPYGRGGTA